MPNERITISIGNPRYDVLNPNGPLRQFFRSPFILEIENEIENHGSKLQRENGEFRIAPPLKDPAKFGSALIKLIKNNVANSQVEYEINTIKHAGEDSVLHNESQKFFSSMPPPRTKSIFNLPDGAGNRFDKEDETGTSTEPDLEN